MKVVKENLNEMEYNEKAEEKLANEISHLRNNVFPKMSDDEVYYFTKRLADWALNALGEKPRFHGK